MTLVLILARRVLLCFIKPILGNPLDGVDFEITTMNKIPPVNRLTGIVLFPSCSLLLLWQASPTGDVGSETVNPMISTPHRHLRDHEATVGKFGCDTSSPSSACIAFRASAKTVLILADEISSPFVPGVGGGVRRKWRARSESNMQICMSHYQIPPKVHAD